MADEARSGVQSIDRVVAILRCFDARTPRIGITELSRRTGLSTSTVHRLLGAMLANELVRQDANRRYALGPLVTQIARSGAIPTTLLDAAQPIALELRDETDETVGIHELLPNGRRAVIGQAESRQELRRTYTEMGVPLPLTHGAPGRAILAFLPAERQRWWLAQDVPPATDRTITDPARSRVALRNTRECGWAHSDGERSSGIRALAAPVFDHSGSVVGALGLSVPRHRLDDERATHLGTRVREVAWQVSATLGATEERVAPTIAAATPEPGSP